MSVFDVQWWMVLFNFLGNLIVVLVGLTVLSMAWRAPEDGSMPLVLKESDKTRDDGIRNLRQVLLSLFGVALIVAGAVGLL